MRSGKIPCRTVRRREADRREHEAFPAGDIGSRQRSRRPSASLMTQKRRPLRSDDWRKRPEIQTSFVPFKKMSLRRVRSVVARAGHLVLPISTSAGSFYWGRLLGGVAAAGRKEATNSGVA